MPQLTKRKKAAIEREKLKKLRNKLEDPLAWTFQNPWRCGVSEPVQKEPVSTEAFQRTTVFALSRTCQGKICAIFLGNKLKQLCSYTDSDENALMQPDQLIRIETEQVPMSAEGEINIIPDIIQPIATSYHGKIFTFFCLK